MDNRKSPNLTNLSHSMSKLKHRVKPCFNFETRLANNYKAFLSRFFFLDKKIKLKQSLLETHEKRATKTLCKKSTTRMVKSAAGKELRTFLHFLTFHSCNFADHKLIKDKIKCIHTLSKFWGLRIQECLKNLNGVRFNFVKTLKTFLIFNNMFGTMRILNFSSYWSEPKAM